jgi:MFS family permease
MDQNKQLWKEFIVSLVAIFFMATGTGAYLLLMVLYLEHLGFPVSTIGSLKSLLSITEGVVVILIVLFFKGHHTRPILLMAILLQISGILIYASQPVNWLIWAATLLTGCGLGFLLIILFALPMQKRPGPVHMGMAVGLYTALIAAGNALGSFVGGWSADNLGFYASFGIAAGFMAVVFACMLLITDVHRIEPPLPSEENSESLPVQSKPVIHLTWRVGVVAGFALASMSVVYETIFPIFALRVLALTTTFVGTLAAIELVMAAAIRPLMGMALKRIKSKSMTIASLAAQALFLCLIPLIGSTFLLPVTIGMMGLSFGIGRVSSETLTMEGISGAQLISKRLSSYRLAMIVGQTLTPLAAGWAADHWGLQSTMIFMPYLILILFFSAMTVSLRPDFFSRLVLKLRWGGTPAGR